MEAATLDDFMAFNDQLAALVEAGVSLELGLESTGDHPAESLERINAAVARRVSRGASLADAIDDDDRLPDAYRCLVQIGLRSGQFDAALDGAQRVADSTEDASYGVRAALFYPLIVCSLVWLGLMGFCLWLLPSLESMQAGMRVPPSRGLRMLQWLRDAMPLWVALPPAALLVWLAWRLLRTGRPATTAPRRGLLSRWPGMTRSVAQLRWANYADDLATLVAAQAPLAEAMPLAAYASGEPSIVKSSRTLADSLEHGLTPRDEHAAVLPFPPLLRWALFRAEPAIDRPRALRMAAEVYRSSAQRGAERVRLVAPVVACAIIGGAAVLLYSLALFVPLVELLKAVALPDPMR